MLTKGIITDLNAIARYANNPNDPIARHIFSAISTLTHDIQAYSDFLVATVLERVATIYSVPTDQFLHIDLHSSQKTSREARIAAIVLLNALHIPNSDIAKTFSVANSSVTNIVKHHADKLSDLVARELPAILNTPMH